MRSGWRWVIWKPMLPRWPKGITINVSYKICSRHNEAIPQPAHWMAEMSRIYKCRRRRPLKTWDAKSSSKRTWSFALDIQWERWNLPWRSRGSPMSRKSGISDTNSKWRGTNLTIWEQWSSAASHPWTTLSLPMILIDPITYLWGSAGASWCQVSLNTIELHITLMTENFQT